MPRVGGSRSYPASQARRSRGKLAISKAPRTPNSLPAAGRDTTASSAASPSIRRTSWSSPGPEHPSAPFYPWVQLPGQAPYGQVEQHGGTLRLHPKCQEIKQNERRKKGRPGEGWRGGAGVSKLPPAICCQLGDSRAPPALRLTGTTLALGGGHTHTAWSHPPPERSRVEEFWRGMLALPPWGSWTAWVPSPQLSSWGGLSD